MGSAPWPRLNVASGGFGGRIAGGGPCVTERLHNRQPVTQDTLPECLYVRNRSFGFTRCHPTARDALIIRAFFEFIGTDSGGVPYKGHSRPPHRDDRLQVPSSVDG